MSLKIAAHGFGPLGDGEVSIAPLTVFIGPNNTGKSFLAMLTYAASHVGPFRGPFFLPRGSVAWERGRFVFYHDPMETRISKEVDSYLRESAVRGKLDPSKAPEEFLVTFGDAVRRNLDRFGQTFVAEIERCFGRSLRELVPRADGASSGTASWIQVTHERPKWSLRVNIGKTRGTPTLLDVPDAARIFRDVARSCDLTRKRVPSELLWADLLELTRRKCFADFPRNAYYLPAARSGILHSHKLLASIIVTRSPLAGIEDMQVPKMTGVISDFISRLLQLGPQRKGKLSSLADLLESDALQGAVGIRGRNRPGYPEIVYQDRWGRHQLQSTSSMVSELAPVVLFLRYLIEPREMVIIEEPESHLHPAIQRRFARILVRVVNSGVTVVLTTHSDYFLNQINNLIVASNLSADQRLEAGFKEEDCLKSADVRAYLFGPGASGQGTNIKAIRVTRKEGISESEFQRAAESLYQETVILQRQLLQGVHENS